MVKLKYYLLLSRCLSKFARTLSQDPKYLISFLELFSLADLIPSLLDFSKTPSLKAVQRTLQTLQQRIAPAFSSQGLTRLVPLWVAQGPFIQNIQTCPQKCVNNKFRNDGDHMATELRGARNPWWLFPAVQNS